MLNPLPVQAGKGRPKRQWQDYNKVKDDVISVLSEHPEGITGARVAEEIGLTQGAVSKYLSMLSVDGLIVSRQVGVAKLWKVVQDSDRAEVLADKVSSKQHTTDFKDYAMSLMQQNGQLFDPEGRRIVTIPSALFTNLYEYVKSIVGDEVHAFLYQWGRAYANDTGILVAQIAKRNNDSFLNSFLLLLRLKGWGRFEINKLEPSEIQVSWLDSFWADLKDDKPVDDFMAGALSTSASKSFGGEWIFFEEHCKALGHPHCVFSGTKR
jgi:predicted hydrocarbon binding protein